MDSDEYLSKHKKINYALLGWADSINGETVVTMVKLAILCAGMGTDWKVEYCSDVKDVRCPATLNIRIERTTSVAYEKGKRVNKNIECLDFQVLLPSYTKLDVFNYTLEELEKYERSRAKD